MGVNRKTAAPMLPREAARELGVTQNWIYQKVWSGQLVAQKVGRSWLIDAQSVAEWKKRRERRALAMLGAKE